MTTRGPRLVAIGLASCLIGASAVMAPQDAVAAPSFEIIDLGILEPNPSGNIFPIAERVVDLSDNGLVAGTLFDTGQNIFVPALWDLNVSTVPTLLQGLTDNSFAQGINNNGAIVGNGRNIADTVDNGFVNAPDGNGGRTLQELAVLGAGGGSRAFAINDQGVITGGADDGVNPQQAFTSPDRVAIQQLGILDDVGDSFARDIAESGNVAGVSGGQAVIFGGGQITQLDETGVFTGSDAAALNEADQVVGRGNLAGRSHAFFSDPIGGVEDLGSLAGPNGDSNAADINNSSQIVGTTDLDLFGTTGGFLYEVDGDAQMFNLNDLLDPNDPLADLTNVRNAVAINDLGQILVTGTRLEVLVEDPEFPEETTFVNDTGEVHAYVLTPSGNNGGGGDGLPAPEVFVEASAKHGSDDAGTQSLQADSGLLVLQLDAELEDPLFDGFAETQGRAEALITNVGVPTTGALSLAGSDVALFNDLLAECNAFDQKCGDTKEATATARVVSHLQPLFADPDAAPDSIDLDLDLVIDGILDVAFFFPDATGVDLSVALAEAFVTAKLHTEDGTTVLFDGGVRLERDQPDDVALQFFGDWDNQEFIDMGFAIDPADSAFADVGNSVFVGGGFDIRFDPIQPFAEFVKVQDAFEDVAFLSPGETYALELEIATRALSEEVLDFTQLSQNFQDCQANNDCDDSDFQAENANHFVLDDSLALADFLNTAAASSSSSTPGVSFIAVDANGNPLPAVGIPLPPTVWLFGVGLLGLGAVAIRRRR